MKMTLKLPKPRNPLVAPAKVRKAGAHGAYNATRHARRVEKHKLALLLSGKKSVEDYDG